MSEEYTYHTIEQEGTAEYKDRGSKFIGYAFPIQSTDDFKERMRGIKQQHSKANHYCFAYRLGTDGLQFRSSDAGEPSGSAGRPILGQIDRVGVTDTLVVVVRYFGGTLLGIPGLINAYKTTAALALQMTPMITKNIEKRYRVSFDYTLMNEMMQMIRQYHCTVLKEEMQLFCMMELGVPLKHLDAFLSVAKELPQLDLTPF